MQEPRNVSLNFQKFKWGLSETLLKMLMFPNLKNLVELLSNKRTLLGFL